MASPLFRPRPEALPREIAVFPLPGALLLPRGRLPLNIFEPRYLAMVEDSLAQGRMFGMIQPDPSGPPGPNPALYRVGCLGRVTSFSETEDGRLLITLSGLLRFAVAEEVEGARGYRRVRADYAPWLADLRDAAPAPLDREGLMLVLRPYFRARDIEVNWDALAEVPDPLLVTTLAMVCPFEPREKQALIEAADPEECARVLKALLQMEVLGGTPEGPPS